MTGQDDRNTVTLEDGRLLEYRVFSTPDVPPSAPTILFFHGSPGSSPEGEAFSTSNIIKHQARLISISRPGYGTSTIRLESTILGWAKDVLAVADHLGIEQFSIAAFSGGGPFALACLASIPQQRLLRTAIVSGMWPGQLGKNETLAITRIIHWASVTPILSTILPYLLELAVGRSARNKQKAAAFEARFVNDVGARHPREAQCLENAEVRHAFVESTRDAFRGGCHGWAMEARLLNSEWNIPMRELDGTRLHVWHGAEDENIPCRLAVQAANSIKGCELHVVDGEAHVSLLASCADQILDRLLSPA
ncbi:alpha/beta hydrolase [Teratosphaeria destructans]|uniref:Alpha/beta hydrolase n=1 Tax=Teratosphaeria destructans TaxID=418781 RepID=A0A9W7SRT6_9PEZI|nr:alpha/beta hydrolase [Teratosphaeria destructans]